MATINREAIDTFMSITGVPESIATQRLEAYGGDLNEAINAHFSDGDRNFVQEAPAAPTAPPSDLMKLDDPLEMQRHGPSSLLSTTKEVREVPPTVRDGHSNLAGHSGLAPRINDVTDALHAEGPETFGTALIDDEDGDSITGDLRGVLVSASNNGPSAQQFDNTTVYENDIEEEMIRAAIEASKRDAELQNKQTAEQERLQREQGLKAGASGSSAYKPVEAENLGKIDEQIVRRQGAGASDKPSLRQHKKDAVSSLIQNDIGGSDVHPLVRNRLRHGSSGSEEARQVGEAAVSPVLSPSRSTVANQTQSNGNAFQTNEWGGISSEEHDEAVMLEAAMFGGIPESRYSIPYSPPQLMPFGLDTLRIPRPPSPSLVAQRTIREQQDDEYLAALQADRERDLRTMEEEKAAKEAAVKLQRQKEEESQGKLKEQQELERQLAAKQASLPEEPPLDDENAVTLLVRMSDGSRHGRRFHKTDKLESLFDFIDIGRIVKPGTYRLVRPFPRRAFSAEESNLTLDELGLTSKQEALFLESI